jgi:hypothetical protein
LKNEGAQGAKLPVGESLHIKQRANKNNCHIKQLVIETQAGKTAFFSEKRGKSAQEVAQCCATSCALGCSPCKSRATEDLGVVFQLFTVQLFAIWGIAQMGSTWVQFAPDSRLQCGSQKEPK